MLGERENKSVTGGLLEQVEQAGRVLVHGLLDYLAGHHFAGVILDEFSRWLSERQGMSAEDFNKLAEEDVQRALGMLISFVEFAESDLGRFEGLARGR